MSKKRKKLKVNDVLEEYDGYVDLATISDYCPTCGRPLKVEDLGHRFLILCSDISCNFSKTKKSLKED